MPEGGLGKKGGYKFFSGEKLGSKGKFVDLLKDRWSSGLFSIVQRGLMQNLFPKLTIPSQV